MFSKAAISAIILSSALLAQDEGLNHYQNQDFGAARDYYESVLEKKGNQPQAQFGRGSSAFQQGDLETAKQAFEQSLKTGDDQLKSKVMYNLGNTFYKNQKVEEALAFYRKALEFDPTDKEAKFNYEFLKYQEQPPEDQQQQEQDKSEENEENQEDQEEQKQSDSENQEKQDQEYQEQENKEDENDQREKKDEDKKEQEEQQENPDQEQQPQPEQQETMEEEKSQDLKQAESILDALKQNEKIMQKQQIARAKSRKLAKDW